MELLQFARAMASLCAVLAMLAGALWVVRRYDVRLPGRVGGKPRGRIGVVERIGIDAKRSLLLIRQDEREHLLLLSPEGHVVLDKGENAEQAAQEQPPETATQKNIHEPVKFSFFPWPKIAGVQAANDAQQAKRCAHA